MGFLRCVFDTLSSSTIVKLAFSCMYTICDSCLLSLSSLALPPMIFLIFFLAINPLTFVYFGRGVVAL